MVREVLTTTHVEVQQVGEVLADEVQTLVSHTVAMLHGEFIQLAETGTDRTSGFVCETVNARNVEGDEL
jgi:hypothetical protein